MRKTKVAFFSDLLIEDYDGAQRTMFHIIDRIPKVAYDYLFITGKGPKNDIGFEVVEIPNLKIPFNHNYSMAMPALAYFKMKKILDKFRPDVIHIASPSLLGNFALEYAKPRSIPTLAIYHTHFISYIAYYLNHLPVVTDIAKASVIRGQKSFYNKCDQILIPTEGIKNELVAYGFDTSKMKLWPRGIDNILFHPDKKNPDRMHQLTGNHHPNILFASRLVWEKNLKTLIKIYEKAKERQLPYNFIIAGDGTARQELESAMPGAIFTGSVSQKDLAFLYASSDVFVFPSISETYGNVVVEAMASGCPVVIANGGGSKSLVDHGSNGYLCPANDAEKYLLHMAKIINNDALKRQFIQYGLDYTNELSWDNLISIYLQEIDTLAANHQYV